MWIWFTRCLPAISVCLLAALLLSALLYGPYSEERSATLPQLILSVYTVVLHLFALFFSTRLCWAMRNVIKKVEEAAKDAPVVGKSLEPIGPSLHKPMQSSSPRFVIILPSYKETTATMEETLRVLASHSQARHSYHLYLAMEDREEGSAAKARKLITTFEKLFFRMSYTVHPGNLPGEAQGKSSNEAWAAQQALRDYPESVERRHVLFTVMDADSHLSSRYFDEVARAHMEHPDTNQTTMYVPPLVFDRNLHTVPLPVRTADLMWAGAGISSMYQSSTVCIPTSVYSLPMTLVDRVGGWDTGPGAIGEDMHMYLKCFFALSGHLNVQVVFTAVSQCNVSSDTPGLAGYCHGLDARYKQGLRHMWGAMDSGYATRRAVNLIKQRYWTSRVAHHANSKNIATKSDGDRSAVQHQCRQSKVDHHMPTPIHWLNILTLFHRLFEAHFLPIHLAVILATVTCFDLFVPGSWIPTPLRIALNLSMCIRVVSYWSMMYFFHLYNRYHRVCVAQRQDEMRRAGLLDGLGGGGFTPKVFQVAGLAETGLFPLGGVIFGSIPALQAVLSHIFTDRLVYVVSLKPQLALRQWRDMSRMAAPSSYTAGFAKASSRKSGTAADLSSHVTRHRRQLSPLLTHEN